MSQPLPASPSKAYVSYTTTTIDVSNVSENSGTTTYSYQQAQGTPNKVYSGYYGYSKKSTTTSQMAEPKSLPW